MSRKAEITIEPASYRPIHAYLRAHAAKFRVYSLAIKPNLMDPAAIRQRVAFAILSANCPFAASVEALDYAIACDYDCDGELMGKYQCVPVKADWLRAMRARGVDEFLRKAGETWIRYRERLKRSTPGLGRCKASFAVALLYPDQANVAVIDTHICHTYLGSEGFIDLSRANYEKIELDIIRLGRQYGLCGFQAHWAIWAFSSGIDHDHNIFPGEHKDSTIPF